MSVDGKSSMAVKVPALGGSGIDCGKAQIQLPILDGRNYRRWSSAVRAYLQTQRLWSIVSAESKLDGASSQEDRCVKNAMVVSILIATVDDVQLQHIVDYELASDQWDALYRIHELPNTPPVLVLLNKFYAFEVGDMTVDDAAAELNRIQAEIRRYHPKETPSDLTKAAALLNGLSASYTDVATGLINEKSVSFDSCVARLRAEETAQKWKSSVALTGQFPQISSIRPLPPLKGPPTSDDGTSASKSVSGSKINPLASTFVPRASPHDVSVQHTLRPATGLDGAMDQEGGAEPKIICLDDELRAPTPQAVPRVILGKKKPSSNGHSVASTNGTPIKKNKGVSTITDHRKGREPCNLCGKRSHELEDCWFRVKDRKGGKNGNNKRVNHANVQSVQNMRAATGWWSDKPTNRSRSMTGTRNGAASDGSIDVIANALSQQWHEQAHHGGPSEEGPTSVAAVDFGPGATEVELISW